MHGRMEHVENYFHFICDLMIKGKLDVKCTPSKEQVVEILTKPLDKAKFIPFKTKLTP